MALTENNLYKFVYLKDHPILSNSEMNYDSLPEFLHSKDIFTLNLSIPNV